MATLTPGTQVGRYRLESEVGRGGMGVVYRAVDPALNRPVALKLLSPHVAGDAQSLARFRREASALANLKHPNIALVYEFGEQQGQPFIALEWVEGRTLRAVLDEEHRLPLGRALRILDQVASALDYAHARGVIHRDVKPSNIIIGADDAATLVDFGLAHLAEAPAITVGSDFLGTPHYLAPEQIAGLPVDGRADLYCLALVAYDMLAGRLPFEAATWPALVHAHLYTAPTPITEFNPALPPTVEAALLKALAKDPSLRFATAAEFGAALRGAPEPAAPAGQPTVQPRAWPVQPPAPAPQRQTGFVIALGAVLLVMAASALLLLGPRFHWQQPAVTLTPTTLPAGGTTQPPPATSSVESPALTEPAASGTPPSATTLEFAPGATAEEVTGELQAGEFRLFSVNALEAQPLIVSLQSEAQDVFLAIPGAGGQTPLLSADARQTTWQGLLPASGTYTLGVQAVGPASSFKLSVELPHRLTFAPGAIATVVTGTASANTAVAYVLRALANQTLTATVSSTGEPVHLNIDSLLNGKSLVPSAADLTSATVNLPATADYIIRAVPVGSEAIDFTLAITVTTQ